MAEVKILIVDDSKIFCQNIGKFLEENSYSVDYAHSGTEAFEKIKSEQYDIVLTDIKMPEMDGIELMRAAKAYLTETFVVVITAYADLDRSIEALRAGAYDILLKPVNFYEVMNKIRHILEYQSYQNMAYIIRKQQLNVSSFNEIIGESEGVKKVIELIKKIAPSDTNVLIYGESGTGKELVARAIHESSPRADSIPVFINCAAIPDTLLESEFFGYTKGAFTGANTHKKGLFAVASGSSLILDEVGELPLNLQPKLLRTIEQKSFLPVGSSIKVDVNTRLICITNRNLEEAVEAGIFRKDLYYRINTFPIHVPPLREHKDDIPLLINYFIRTFRQRLQSNVIGITIEALEQCMAYDWPGNVRELLNVIERAIIIAKDKLISISDLPLSVVQNSDNEALMDDLKTAVNKYRIKYINSMVDFCNGDKEEAAKRLNISSNQQNESQKLK